jgi:GT2 family glycosyltransferase
MTKTCPITVGIPTYQRLDKLPIALKNILQCEPKPDEIIVHIDGNDSVTESWMEDNFPDLKVLKSETQVGPGGGRNKIIKEAKNPIIASFDDDSYPLDADYFLRLTHLFAQFPDAGVIAASIFHQEETINPDTLAAFWTADFIGCGCAYRREVFLQTSGYVSLPLAYGMEETDLSLRLHGMGWKILSSSWLRVFHDTQLKHHEDPRITAASIANQALLAYLRYPVSLWGLGVGQCASRIYWLVRHQRYQGILEGIASIPTLLWKNKQKRQSLSYSSVFSYLKLRKNKIALEPNEVISMT